jgi:membrane protease YdiL (CAAX protease family)
MNKLIPLKKSSTQKSQNKNKPASIWLIVGVTFGIFLVTQILAVIIVEIILGIMHHDIAADRGIDQSAPAQFFYILLAEGGAIWLVLKALDISNLSLEKIGLGRRPVVKDLVRGMLGFATFFAILVVVNGLLSQIFPELNKEQQDVGFNILNTSLDKMLALFSLVVLPPLGEEILVRGYLYSGLRAKLRFLPAALITSLLFGLAHLQLGSGTAVVWAAGIDTFILSLVLVYLREKSGALYAGMLVHALNNLIAFGVHFK